MIASQCSPVRGRSRFERLLYEHLLPEFCFDPKRNYPISAFRSSSLRVSDADARDFVRAWDAGLLEHRGRGLYRAPRSAASEQFFWQGRKVERGRTITLWLEPIITIAALARLHLDFGWPRELLGTQSRDYAFDVMAFAGSGDQEHIAGEVKKSVGEVDQLIEHMQLFVAADNLDMAEPKAKELNAFRKVAALIARRAPVFWIVGPAGLCKTFVVGYDNKGRPELHPSSPSVLKFRGSRTRQ